MRLEQVEPRHVGQPQIEDDAIGRLLPQRSQRFGAGADRGQIDVVVAEKLGNSELLRRIVLDDQQPLAPRLGVILDPRQRRSEILGRARLSDEGEGAARKTVLAVLVERDDLHRNMPRCRILLQLAQHGPAQHVRQEDIERDGGRLIFAGKRQRLAAAHRDQRLEPLIMRQIRQDAGVMRVVFDDQQRRVVRRRSSGDRPASIDWRLREPRSAAVTGRLRG